METFVKHPDYPNYLIGNEGTIISVVNPRAHKMKACPNKYGYYVVTLTNHGKNKSYYVHDLVGKCFVNGWFEGAEIDHIDTDKANNRADNLQWVTHLDNLYNPLTLAKRTLTGNGCKPIRCIEDDLEFPSINAAARYYNIEPNSIGMVCKGEYKQTHKLHFCFI